MSSRIRADEIRNPPPMLVGVDIKEGSFAFQKATGGGTRPVKSPYVTVSVRVPRSAKLQHEVKAVGKKVTIKVWAKADPHDRDLVAKEKKIPIDEYGLIKISLVSGTTVLQEPKSFDSPDLRRIPRARNG